MDDERELLVRGIAAARAGSKDEARRDLLRFLDLHPAMHLQSQAWNYLAEISDRADEKRNYLSRVLAYDPTDGTARRALAIGDGRLNASEIIDPEHSVSGQTPTTVATNPVLCPQCGSGHLTASLDGTSLVCEHCGHTEPMASSRAAQDRDFFAAIWTAKGHRTAEPARTFTCAACGASYLLADDATSLTCSFCGAVHVSLDTESRSLITPDGFVPFAIGADAIAEAVDAMTLTRTPAPIYLPAWSFTFAGTVHWIGFDKRRNDAVDREMAVTGDYPILDVSSLVSATPQLPDSLESLLDGFALSSLDGYRPLKLAGRLVAIYQRSLADASVAARRKALTTIGAAVKDDVTGLHRLELRFSDVDVDAYKLLLLPFWIAVRQARDGSRLVFVNGQNGRFAEAAPLSPAT